MKTFFTSLLTILISTISFAQYYQDLTNDIRDGLYMYSYDDVEAGYNLARTKENTALGTSLPAITMPVKTTWDAMSAAERGLWIINIERIDRGLKEYEGTDEKLNTIVRNYARFVLDNDTIGHFADGNTQVSQRLDVDPDVQGKYDIVYENIGYTYRNNLNGEYPMEEDIYMFIYVDSVSNWGHRHNVFRTSFTEDFGSSDKEGLLGIADEYVAGYQGYPHGWLTCINFVDPKSTWQLATGINSEYVPTENISIYPNPSKQFVSVGTSYKTLNILDITGKVIATHSNQRQLDISNLTSGIYFFQIDDTFQKVIKE